MISQLPLMQILAVAAAGTAQQFAQKNIVTPANNTQQTATAPGIKVVPWLFSRLEIRPLTSNTGLIYVGQYRDLVAGALTGPLALAHTDFPLVLESCSPHVPIDLNGLWFDTSVSGSSVMIIGTPFRR